MATRQETLQKQYDVLCEKIDRLRQAHAIETDESERFRLEKKIAQAEKDCAEVGRELKKLGVKKPSSTQTKPQSSTPVSQTLLPAFLVLILVIGTMIGVGYLSKDALFSLFETYSKDFGVFVIYTGFVGLSLIVAIVMFGILRSTGVLKKTGKENQYEFGGAMAGFLATLMFLVISYSQYNPPPTVIEILGNVQVVENGKTVGLVEDAIIAIARHPEVGRKNTDESGNFRFELPENQDIQEIELLITYQGKTFSHPISRSDMGHVKIEIEQTQRPEENQGKENVETIPSVHIEQTGDGSNKAAGRDMIIHEN